MKPNAFIGSSAESLDLVYAIQNNLKNDANIIAWTQGVFQTANSTIDSLIEQSEDCEFGIFLFSPADIAEIKVEKVDIVRDNVLFEYGLFVGKLGKKRTFFVLPKDTQNLLRLPTDLLGITPATYDSFDPKAPPSLDPLLGPACNQIRAAMKTCQPLSSQTDVSSPISEQIKEHVSTVTVQCKNEIIEAINGYFGNSPSSLPEALTSSINQSIVINEIESLSSNGKPDEAETLAKKLYEDQPQDESVVETYISVLLKFDNREKTELAWQILDASSLKKIQVFTNLGLCFWELGEFERAVNVDQKALTLAEANNDMEATNKIKGNVAYFMAETGNSEYRDRAYQFATVAHEAEPSRTSRIDTLGYVKITFGDLDEIREGMRMCLDAYAQDVKAGCSNKEFYDKHIHKATKRLKNLGDDSTPSA